MHGKITVSVEMDKIEKEVDRMLVEAGERCSTIIQELDEIIEQQNLFKKTASIEALSLQSPGCRGNQPRYWVST